MELSEKIRQAKNAYSRAYRQNNPDKIREYNNRYWERKVDPVGSDVRKLSKEGSTQRQIAEKLKISLGAVNNILNDE